MPNNYEQQPRVEFSVSMGNFEQARAVASHLAALGMPNALEVFQIEHERAIAASKVFIRNAAAEEVDEAQKLESQQVGHSKSDYVPTGTL